MNYKNKLIPDWDKDQQISLRTEIEEFIDYMYSFKIKDIQAAGSRVFGGFKKKSDIDIVVFVDDKIDDKINDKILYDNINVDLYIFQTPKNGVLHRNCYQNHPLKPEGRNLPHFSLYTFEIIGGDEKDIKNHIEYRKYIGKKNRKELKKILNKNG